MNHFIVLAIGTGFFITLNRVFNASLSNTLGSFQAVTINFAVGLCALTLVMFAKPEVAHFNRLHDISLFGWLSGPISLLFLALATWTFPKLGALKTTLLIISGQMVSAALIDCFSFTRISSFEIQLLGITSIIAGVAVSRFKVGFK